MRLGVKLRLLQAGSAFCLGLASIGNLEPTYTLESGVEVNSWAIARSTGQQVIDVSPSLGFLKLAVAMAGFGLAGWALFLCGPAEEAEAARLAEVETLQEFSVEQKRLISQAEIEAMKPVAAAVAEDKANKQMVKLAASGAVAALPPIKTETVDEIKPAQYDEQLPNFPEEFGKLGRSAMLVGVGGAGKGMFTSHAGRAYRQARPNALIWVIDLKNDEKEKEYWEGWVNQRFAKDIDTFRDPAHLLDWLETVIYKFRDTHHDGPKLLVFDEFLSGSKRSQIADAKRHKYLVDYLASISSNGDSRQISFWGIGQIANATDYGFSAGTRSMFVPIAIVFKGNQAASKQLLGTTFAPTDDKAAVMQMMDYSPVGRAIYWGPEGKWYPMPKLHNYSGYNRDKREVEA